MEARRDKNYYFDIFQNYALMHSLNSIHERLKTDFEFWEVP